MVLDIYTKMPMKLRELYIESVMQRFYQSLREDYALTEISGKLAKLLSQADELVFDKFGIDPKDHVYFIAGSARLYLYPDVITAFKVPGEIGDLDMVIPDKQLWINAGLADEYAAGVYEPVKDSIVVYTKWDPRKAGEQYADVKVASDEDILKRADLVQGYWFMDFVDIFDYKTKLSRDKESEFLKLMRRYFDSDARARAGILLKIIRLIGVENAREFLDMPDIGKTRNNRTDTRRMGRGSIFK